MKMNKNYLQLEESYLFQTIAQKVTTYEQLHPEAKLIKLGIGDVTKPLCKSVIKAMAAAIKDMGRLCHQARGYYSF